MWHAGHTDMQQTYVLSHNRNTSTTSMMMKTDRNVACYLAASCLINGHTYMLKKKMDAERLLSIKAWPRFYVSLMLLTTSSIMTLCHWRGFRGQGSGRKPIGWMRPALKHCTCTVNTLHCKLFPQRVKQQLHLFWLLELCITCGIDFRVMLRKKGLCIEVAFNNGEVLNLRI